MIREEDRAEWFKLLAHVFAIVVCVLIASTSCLMPSGSAWAEMAFVHWLTARWSAVLSGQRWISKFCTLRGCSMVSHHYGTQTVNRGAVLPGMLVKHREGVWTASANKYGRPYLHHGIGRTYTADLLVKVYLNGLEQDLSR